MGTKVQDLYRDSFGQVFHGHRHALIPSKRYSLEPLREGPAALSCNPQGDVGFAELKSLKIELPGGQRVIIENRVFDALNGLNTMLLPTVSLLEAVISLKLVNRKKRVIVKICPERDTILGASGDPAIDEWLVSRRFANTNHESQLLASA